MSKLPINWDGYTFQIGLDVLKLSYEVARKALVVEINRARKEMMFYKDYLNRGGEWVGEQDEEGYVLWDQEGVLKMRIEAIQNTLKVLRKSFAISIYQLWERSALGWTSTHRPARKNEYKCIKKYTLSLGYPIEPKLDLISLLANTLKHNSEDKGKKLLNGWPNLFGTDFDASKCVDWYESVHLTHAHVLQIISIVERSGPTAKMLQE